MTALCTVLPYGSSQSLFFQFIVSIHYIVSILYKTCIGGTAENSSERNKTSSRATQNARLRRHVLSRRCGAARRTRARGHRRATAPPTRTLSARAAARITRSQSQLTLWLWAANCRSEPMTGSENRTTVNARSPTQSMGGRPL